MQTSLGATRPHCCALSCSNLGFNVFNIIGLTLPTPPPPHTQLADHHSYKGSFHGMPDFCYCHFISFWSPLAWHKPALQVFMPNAVTLNSRTEGKLHPSSSSKCHWLADSPQELSWMLRPSAKPEVRGGPPQPVGPQGGMRDPT